MLYGYVNKNYLLFRNNENGSLELPKLKRKARAVSNYYKAYPITNLCDIIEIKNNTIEQKKNYECTICFEEISLNAAIRAIPCKHIFHLECLDVWVIQQNPFCPLCRFDICGHYINR
ncbi:hypothetical protein BB561_006390 [Smittium simulii]|uniref:RING-type domain-containing protein n=1 Tax=Smittium simulii TaxID=133385 RepID=A0A2T9Y4T4_9FUNG|nr:hypothetical protein BB561_006390 [Smittium simulii]